MDVLISDIVFHPFVDLMIVLSALAGISFVIFLAGFLSGLQHLYKIDENADLLKTYRARVTWGTVLLVFFMVVWEIIRWIAGFFM